MIAKPTILIIILAVAVLLGAGCAAETIPSAGNMTAVEPDAPFAYEGYDLTAYFALEKAVRGTPQLSFVWNGARYLFTSKENRDTFAAAPEKFLPGFESHCPVSLAEGNEIDGDPSVWRIFGDRLYFFTNEGAAERFDREPEKILSKAEEASN